MRLSTKLILAGVLGVSIVSAGALLWRHYSGLVDAKAELSAKVSALEADVLREKTRAEGLEEVNGAWADASRAQTEAITQFARAQREAGSYSKELKDVLSTHDLDRLASRKPKLVEAHINAGTDRALRLLERASQGPAQAGGGAATGGDPATTGAGRP